MSSKVININIFLCIYYYWSIIIYIYKSIEKWLENEFLNPLLNTNTSSYEEERTK